MKIAIPFFQNRVSNRLDCCENILLATVEGGKVAQKKKMRLLKNRPVFLSEVLSELGVEILICGAIPETYLEQMEKQGIRVYSFVSGDIDHVLKQFLKNKLDNNPNIRINWK